MFAVLVNSMLDECTRLAFTWFNSPLHADQSPQTLINMVQIGQWYHGSGQKLSLICTSSLLSCSNHTGTVGKWQGAWTKSTIQTCCQVSWYERWPSSKYHKCQGKLSGHRPNPMMMNSAWQMTTMTRMLQILLSRARTGHWLMVSYHSDHHSGLIYYQSTLLVCPRELQQHCRRTRK